MYLQRWFANLANYLAISVSTQLASSYLTLKLFSSTSLLATYMQDAYNYGVKIKSLNINRPTTRFSRNLSVFVASTKKWLVDDDCATDIQFINVNFYDKLHIFFPSNYLYTWRGVVVIAIAICYSSGSSVTTASLPSTSISENIPFIILSICSCNSLNGVNSSLLPTHVRL